jgi:hypothetical protein
MVPDRELQPDQHQGDRSRVFNTPRATTERVHQVSALENEGVVHPGSDHVGGSQKSRVSYAASYTGILTVSDLETGCFSDIRELASSKDPSNWLVLRPGSSQPLDEDGSQGMYYNRAGDVIHLQGRSPGRTACRASDGFKTQVAQSGQVVSGSLHLHRDERAGNHLGTPLPPLQTS